MASFKTSNKSTKMKSKVYSDVSTRKGPEKTKKEKGPNVMTKIVVRRLPPSMTEESFIESVSPLAEYDYFAFINADSSLGSSAYCRAYINFKHVDDVYTFRDKFDGYVFVDQKGNEHPAMVEYAPFQKIPKRVGSKKKDARCGTIDEDADYLAFLESLTKPVTITLPPLEAVLEEIQAHDRELKANNGLIKVKTPLLEYIEQRKAEKLRSKEEKKEERRRKEFERKKAREEERKKKKEIREHHREMKKEQKDDNSVKVLRPERGKEDYVSEGRQEKTRAERDRERQKREEEKIKLRKEKEKLRREREKEERLRRLEDKAKQREEEKSKHKEDNGEDAPDEKMQAAPSGKPEGLLKSKRYSEGRRKEREKDRTKDEREKDRTKDEREKDRTKDEREKDRTREEREREKKASKDDSPPDEVDAEAVEEEVLQQEKLGVKEECESPRKEERSEERPISRKRREKDPRVERRIRNKDRPAMALYRPGQSRLSSRMRQDREEGAETSSSSPSPVMPAGGEQPPQKKSSSVAKENMDSSTSDVKDENPDTIKDTEDSANSKLATSDTEAEHHDKENDECEESSNSAGSKDQEDKDQEDGAKPEDETKDVEEMEVEEDSINSSSEGQQMQPEEDAEDSSKDDKKYPGVKSMTFRRSVSRE